MLRRLLDHIATAALVVIALSVLWDYRGGTRERPRRSTPVPATAVMMENAPRHGSPGAPVGLMVFSDFQCAYCAKFATETLPRLVDKYVDTGVAQILFRHFYNRESHKQADQLAQATICAGDQKQFWKAHDRLFSMPADRLSVDQLVADLGLNRPNFERCMSTHAFTQLETDRRLAEALGVLGTPTTVIGKVSAKGLSAVAVVDGAQPLAVFEAAIKRAR